MRLVHESADGRRAVLATDVERADSLLAQTRGLMGRSAVPEDYALVFPARTDPVEAALARLPLVGRLVAPERQAIHMLFVRTPLDVLWVRNGEVVQVRTLPPWRGHASAPADLVVEMAAGAADGVSVGDRLVLEADDDDSVAGTDPEQREASVTDGAETSDEGEPAPLGDDAGDDTART